MALDYPILGPSGGLSRDYREFTYGWDVPLSEGGVAADVARMFYNVCRQIEQLKRLGE